MPIFDRYMGDNVKKTLKEYIERIEKLEVDKQAIADDIKELFAQSKGEGFDTKIMRTVIKRRKIEKAERDETDDMIKVYEDNLEDVEDLIA